MTALKQSLAVAWLLVLVASSFAAEADISVRFDIAYGDLPRPRLT